MKKVIVIGTHSFIDGGCRVGSQYLAKALAACGYQVDYIATASSLLDVWGRKRHARLKRVWAQGQDTNGVELHPRLTEWAFKAPFPALKLFLRWRWQLAAYNWFVPKAFRQRQYDICIVEVTPNLLYMPWVQAKMRVLRLNDWPPGFAHDLHPLVIEQMEVGLIQASFDDTWAVSRPLAAYANKLNSQNKVLFLPNGVDDTFLKLGDAPIVSIDKEPNSAAYIGSLGAWFDIDLLKNTAVLLPHWHFDLYGAGSQALTHLPPNIKGHGSIARAEVPSLLSRYEVGLIPFADTDQRMAYVERPLKFYEYIAANLGVASTSHGALRSGMGDLATYGNTASEFAEAIVDARSQAKQRAPDFGTRFVGKHGWGTVTREAQSRLLALCSSSPLSRP